MAQGFLAKMEGLIQGLKQGLPTKGWVCTAFY